MLAIGSLGYLVYGPQVQTVVFMNLPSNTWTRGIQLLYCLAIAFSFPLTVYPPIRITESYIFGSSHSGRTSLSVKWSKNIYRSLLVTVLGIIAIGGSSSLDKFVSLIGSFACIPLSFIYPSLFHAKSVATDWRIQVKDWSLAFFGFVCMVYSTWVTLREWSEDSGNDNPLCGVGGAN